MAFTVANHSFAGGEIDPALNARTDQVKYQTGLATMRNWIATRQGAAVNRAGTFFVCPLHGFKVDRPRTIPFVFNNDQAYDLVFQDQLLVIVQNGRVTTETPIVITGITAAHPPVVSSAAHGYLTGDLVLIAGVQGMQQVNDRFFTVTHIDANTFSLGEFAPTDGSGYTAYVSGGTAARVFALVTPYLLADLPLIRFVQSADVMTLTCPGYPVYYLSRLSLTNWSLAAAVFGSGVTPPLLGNLVGTGGGDTVRYQVTAVADDTLEESYSGLGALQHGSLDASVTPWSYHLVAHGYATGDQIALLNHPALPGISDTRWPITVTDADHFTLDGSISTGIAGITIDVSLTALTSTAITFPTAGNPVTVSWSAVAGALEYNIYREVNGIFSYVGTAVSLSFVDLGYAADPLDTPPVNTPIFAEVGQYPAACGFCDQRAVFGGAVDDIEGNRASRTGLYKNFSKSNPIQDDDAIHWTIASDTVNAVMHYLEMDRLFVFTKGSTYTIEGNDAGTLTPSGINPRKRTGNGTGPVRPLSIGQAILHVQYEGNIVNEISPGQIFGSFDTRDLTIWSAHLIRGQAIIDWAYARVPNSVIWCVRDDGALIGLTYMRDQDVWGWHRHDTGDTDTFLAVSAIPEGRETATYMAVLRARGGGRDLTCIERMATRAITQANVATCCFLDCAVQFDGRNADTTARMELATTGGWAAGDPLTIERSSGVFTVNDVGTHVWLRVGTDLVDVIITGADGSGTADCEAIAVVPASLQHHATNDWSIAIDAFLGLWHLEGREVYALVNAVPAGPFTVTDGEIALPDTAEVATVGISITADIATLEPENPQGETWADKTKTVAEVALKVVDTLGISVGLSEDQLQDYDDAWADPDRFVAGELFTGLLKVTNFAQTSQAGSVLVRQSLPLPATVLGIYPRMDIGDA